MKCYYEILEVCRDADDGEIKTAYRKLALKWHPDKNIDNVEAAKEQFQLVQQAYEVLSDRQERAWYDNHREQILRGSDTNFQDDSLDVFQYFTTQCFRGYGDDEKGFYTVYRKVFEKIAAEDIEYMDSKSDFDEIPNFGNSTSDYDDIVGPFYAYWMSYTTKKSYVWLDPYNIKETRERRVLKLIEKENKKVRQKAKKERNEEIRNLVAFVRKRDKRVQAYSKSLEAKNAENRQKQEQLRKQKLLERQKELANDKAQADWSKFDNVKAELDAIEKNLAEQFGENLSDSDINTSDEEENDPNDLYCVACNKLFKTPKAFANHESSKKHRENVEKLKVLMQEEDEEANGTDLEDEEAAEIGNEEVNLSENLDQFSDSEEKSSETSKKKTKKNKKVIRIQHTSESAGEKSDIETKVFDKPIVVSDDDFDFGSTKKQKKKNAKQKAIQENVLKTNTNVDNAETTLTENTPTPVEKEKKSHSKNANKKTKQNKNSPVSVPEDIDTSHCCVSCKSKFDSKNKLFEHLKKTGHSVMLPQKAAKSRKKQVK